jgi:hypothetical protein
VWGSLPQERHSVSFMDILKEAFLQTEARQGHFICHWGFLIWYLIPLCKEKSVFPGTLWYKMKFDHNSKSTIKNFFWFRLSSNIWDAECLICRSTIKSKNLCFFSHCWSWGLYSWEPFFSSMLPDLVLLRIKWENLHVMFVLIGCLPYLRHYSRLTPFYPDFKLRR